MGRGPDHSRRTRIASVTRTIIGASLALHVLALSACAAAPVDHAPESSTIAAPAPPDALAATSTAARREGPRGLEDCGNDPTVVALARRALECAPRSHARALDAALESSGCFKEAFTAWRAHDFRQHCSTLVALLEDDDVLLGELAALAFDDFFPDKGRCTAHRGDVALAGRIFTALEGALGTPRARARASAAGTLDLQATGLLDRARLLLKDERANAVSGSFYASMIDLDPTAFDAQMRAYVLSSADVEQRRIVLVALMRVPGICKFWIEVAAKLDDEAGQQAASLASKPYQCTTTGEKRAIVAVLERKLASPQPDRSWSYETLYSLALSEDGEPTGAPLEKLLKGVIDNRAHHTDVRIDAARALHALPGARHAAYLKKLRGDQDALVASCVTAWLAKKDPDNCDPATRAQK